MAEARFVISVHDQSLASIDDVVDRLRRAGLNVQQVNRRTGIVTGTAPAERRDDLGRVPGVAAVRDEREYRIAPPASDIQ